MTDHRTERSDVAPLPAVDDPEDRPGCHDPANPAAGSLERSLDQLMAHVRDTTHVSTTLQFDGWEPFDDEEKTARVLEFVRRAVDDALLSADATHIVVSLVMDGRRCEVCIRDDGTEHVPAAEGAEPRRLEQVARLLGGSLRTERRKTRGTAVRLTFEE